MAVEAESVVAFHPCQVVLRAGSGVPARPCSAPKRGGPGGRGGRAGSAANSGRGATGRSPRPERHSVNVCLVAAGALAAALSPVASGCPSRAPVGPQVVAVVAANLRDAFQEIAREFEAANAGVRVKAVYTSSGAAAQQIRQGAPFDIFFSGDVGFARDIERAGLAEPGTFRIYARGRLALWISNRTGLRPDAGLDVLAEPAVERIAIANPQTAPYGRAAAQALRSAGLFDRVERRLVYGQDVSQAAQIALAAADAAILPWSFTSSPALLAEGAFAPAPEGGHEPIEQAVVVLRGRDRREVRALCEFVSGPAGRRILEAHGYAAP